uniref:General transcription factor 3C polypeptide 5 n=1 Tax=Panagrolaimus sp. PS1159 TaxID=55785 RepID=A0AC35F735_9BILA
MNFYGKKKFFNLSDNRTFHLVYHPMIIENPENAIRSIGGFKNFASIVQDRRSMMLSVQPDNEYHAGMFNDRPKSGKVTTQLVVKFQKNKRTGAIRSQVLGVVKNAYHFNSICDFQFLPLEKEPNSDNCFHDLVPKIVPTNLTDALSWWDRPPADDESLAANFLPPYIFSRYTKPSNRILAPEELPQTAADASTAQELLVFNKRPERKSFAVIVQGTDEFPKEPTQEAVDDVNQRCRPQEPHLLLQALFQERPMWTRPAIICETGIEDSSLKAILPKFGFYIGSGPFGRCWCKFGYDPREHPDAKSYQTISVSFRFNELIPEKFRLKVCGRTTVSRPEERSLPHARQMWYCVCDIKLPVAEEILKTDITQVMPKYDTASGWLPADIIETLREAIKSDVAATMSSMRESEEISMEVQEEDEDIEQADEDIF